MSRVENPNEVNWLRSNGLCRGWQARRLAYRRTLEFRRRRLWNDRNGRSK